MTRRYRLVRARRWPGGFRTRGTRTKFHGVIAIFSIPIDQQSLVALYLLFSLDLWRDCPGVAFGLVEGTLRYFSAICFVNLAIYGAKRRWLRGRVMHVIERRARLHAACVRRRVRVCA